jgi:disulfide bond formation protein DsbB
VGLSLRATSSDHLAFAADRFPLGIGALSLGIAAISALSVGGALAIEHIGGIRPCPLCLDQRIAYYAAIPAGLLAAWLAGRAPAAARLLLALLAIGFVANTALGVYHSGIEWGWWPGPDSCSGLAPIATTPEALRESMRQPSVVRCDAAALRILGISLAGYSAAISGLLAVLALTSATQGRARNEP